MDTDRLNRWMTLLANIAVVAGIIFLGLEIRQNNELLRFEAGSIYFENRVWGINKALENPEFAQVLFKARSGDDLDDYEEFLITGYYRRIFLGLNWEFNQARVGRLEISRNERWREIIAENRYADATWKWAAENILTSDFVQYMNSQDNSNTE